MTTSSRGRVRPATPFLAGGVLALVAVTLTGCGPSADVAAPPPTMLTAADITHSAEVTGRETRARWEVLGCTGESDDSERAAAAERLSKGQSSFEGLLNPATNDVITFPITGLMDVPGVPSGISESRIVGGRSYLPITADTRQIYPQLKKAPKGKTWFENTSERGTLTPDPGTYGWDIGEVVTPLTKLGDNSLSYERTDSLRGTTVHIYRATVKSTDSAELLRVFNRDVMHQEDARETMSAEVWLDAEQRVRRTVLAVPGHEAEIGNVVKKDCAGSTIAQDYFDFGTAPLVEAPPADQVWSTRLA